MNACDVCDKPTTSDCIDVWDENAAWLRYCSWDCVLSVAILRVGG